MKMNKYILSILISVVSFEFIHSQDTLEGSASFVGDLKLFLRDANKISSQPYILNPLKESEFVVQYKMLPTRTIATTSPTVIQGGAFPLEKKLLKLQHGSFDLAFGSYLTPRVNLYYTDGRSKKGDYGIWMHHQSSNADINLFENRDIPTTYSENYARIWGKRFIKSKVLSGNVDWKRDMNHWYGIDSLQLDSFADFSTLKQIMSRYHAELGLATFDKDSADLNWWGKTAYTLGLNQIGGSEHVVNFNAGGSKRINTELFSVDFGLSYNRFNVNAVNWSRDIPNSTVDGSYTSQENRYFDNAVIKLIPSAQTVWKELRAKVGMGLYVQSYGQRRAFFYPLAEVSYNFLDGLIVPYAGIKGSLEHITYLSLQEKNPFIGVQPQLMNQDNKLQLFAGVNGTIARNVNYMTGFEMNRSQNFAFFVNDSLFSFGNQMGVEYGTLNYIRGKAELEVLGGSKWEAKLGGSYTYFETPDQDHAWHQPNLNIYGEGLYKLNEKLKFSLGAQYIGERWVKSYVPVLNQTPNPDQTYYYKLKGYVDVNARVSFVYNNRLSAYVQANNAIAQKYAIWGGFPTQRIQAFMGATYSF
jgi:hypothetical protein